MSTTLSPERPAAAPTSASGLEGRAGRWLVVLALLASAAGLLAGVLGGPLWLDEAISVEIARRDVPDLLSALRQDGAPPLYYLLLHGWMTAFGTGTAAVRTLTVLLVPVALALAWLLGRRLGGVAGGRAAVVVLAALPWTMRYGSETRMYLLVVVLSLTGALVLREVHRRASPAAVVGLGLCAAALLLTHYWSLFLLTVVGTWHLPGLVRRRPEALRVVAGLALGGVLFLPWLPTFLFQASRTGAPWADAPGVVDLLRAPTYWGGGGLPGRIVFALVLVPLVVAAARRVAPARPLVGVATGTLLLAWTASQLTGAWTGRYTAVVVPLVCVAAGLGAASLPRRWPVVALAALTGTSAVIGIPAAANPRTSAGEIAEDFREAARPGDVLLYCPDQLGPPMARALGPGYEQVVYPTLEGPELVDWVDYTARNEAADPAAVAARVHALAGPRQLFVLKASGYRTFEDEDESSGRDDDCDALVDAVVERRGAPEHLFGEIGSTGQLLFRFDGA